MSERYKRWILSYGLGVAAGAAALGLALLADLQGLKALELPLFLMAIGAVVWYAGPGPGVLAVVLAGMSFNYFFTPPRHCFYIQPADRVNFVVFVLFALLIGWFASRRRRIEHELRGAQDELQRLNKD